MTEYLLYLVPKTQPAPSSQAKIYGGYHVTLFPEQPLPQNYDLVKDLKGFNPSPTTKSVRWTFPENYKEITLKRMGLNQVYFKDSTLSRLLEWVSGPTRKGVWNEENKWDPFHMTLGSYEFPEPVDKDDLINIFTNEKEWFIQLVKKIPKVANPKRPKDYDWFWDPNQRVILYQKD